MEKINKILIKALERLDDDDYMEDNNEYEVARCNAISKNAQTYLNAIKTNMQILELSQKLNTKYDKLKKELGA